MIAEKARSPAIPWVMLLTVSLPFVVLAWLLVTTMAGHLDHYRRIDRVIETFSASQHALNALERMAVYGPSYMLLGEPGPEAQFEAARAQVGPALDVLQRRLQDVGDPVTADYAQVIQKEWQTLSLTSSTSYPLDSFDAVNRVVDKVYSALVALLYFMDLDAGRQVRVFELLMLFTDDMKSARRHASSLHAMSVFVASRGGYLPSADAARIDQAWSGLQSDLQNLSRRFRSIRSRAAAAPLAAGLQDSIQEIRDYLDFIEEHLLLADVVELDWRIVDEQGRLVDQTLQQLAAWELALARELLQREKSRQFVRDALLAIALTASYLLVVGIGVLFYRSRYRMMQALAESRTKSQFLARMSHEIRTPLNGVIGLVELLRETDPNPRQREYIGLIDSAGRSLVSLVNDILDYAKIEAGKLELERRPLDLYELVNETAQMFSLQAHDSRSLLLCNIGSGVPRHVEGDAIRLRQVLINLIGNAVKFTRRGWIEVRLSRRRRTSDSSVLRFEVQDSGIGLSPEEQRQLFGMFSQASPGVARRFGGTGLGLSISRELVRLMGGDIEVISARNWGSTFWFDLSLPCAADEEEAVTPAPLHEPALLLDPSGVLSRLVRAAGRLLDEVVAVGSVTAAQAAMANPECRFALLVVHCEVDGDQAGQLDDILQALRPLQLPVRVLTGVRGALDVSTLSGVESVVNRSVFDLEQLVDLFRVGARSSARALPSLEAAGVEPLPGMRVMVAEDNPVNQLVTCGYLRKLGIEPVLAEDGHRAVQLFSAMAGGFDVILMDLDMPVLDGPAAARQIRALEAENGWPRCRILALSAHAMPEYSEQVRAAGMDGQLVKPVTLAQLADALRIPETEPPEG